MDHVQNDVERKAKEVVQAAQDQPWIEHWVRLGYAVRGVLYFVMGFLALQLVSTGNGEITDQQGALAAIASQPFGRTLMIIITVGLAGYALWGFYRAIFDPWHKGTDLKGIVSRVGYAVSGIIYGILVVPSYQLIRGVSSGEGGSQTAQQFASGVLTKPWGPWLVGFIGVVILGVGIYEIWFGLKEKFLHNLEQYKMDSNQRDWAKQAGKFGYIALGVVMLIVGGLTLLAAIRVDSEQIGGIDQALRFLLQTPYGPFLLALVAFGLLAYAVYSFIGAIWFKVKVE